MTDKNIKQIRQFLNHFSFADDDKKKAESIQYICDILSEAESSNKVLQFDKMGEIEFSPNPLLDHSGKLLFDTKSFMQFFDEYTNRVKYVESEIANIIREDYCIMREIAETPLSDPDE